MTLSLICYVVAVIIFGVEAFRTKSLIAAGLAFFAAAFIVAGSVPLK